METKKKSVSEYVQEYGAFIALIVLVVGIGIVSPEFRTWSNFLSLLRQSSINGFIAFVFSKSFGLIVSTTSPLITALSIKELYNFLATINLSEVFTYSSSPFKEIPVFAGSVQGVVVQIIILASIS